MDESELQTGSELDHFEPLSSENLGVHTFMTLTVTGEVEVKYDVIFTPGLSVIPR